MPIIRHTSGGGIKLGGCGAVRVADAIVIKFPIGGIFYNCKAARRGCIEAICVKSYKMTNSLKTGGLLVVIYVDTLNGLWNEDELCTKTQAVAAAEAYYTKQLAAIAFSLSQCPIS